NIFTSMPPKLWDRHTKIKALEKKNEREKSEESKRVPSMQFQHQEACIKEKNLKSQVSLLWFVNPFVEDLSHEDFS
ncbi:unnamed protein product, partial [Sphenostylis stenocarpa]